MQGSGLTYKYFGQDKWGSGVWGVFILSGGKYLSAGGGYGAGRRKMSNITAIGDSWEKSVYVVKTKSYFKIAKFAFRRITLCIICMFLSE